MWLYWAIHLPTADPKFKKLWMKKEKRKKKGRRKTEKNIKMKTKIKNLRGNGTCMAFTDPTVVVVGLVANNDNG